MDMWVPPSAWSSKHGWKQPKEIRDMRKAEIAEEQDAEQDIISRVPELRKLNDNIEQATNTCVNARLGLESAIQQYQCAENKLDDSVTTISGKVDTCQQC